MFSLVLFLLIDTCLGYSFGPPYGTCNTFLTGHPNTATKPDGTVAISLLKQGLATFCYTPGEAYTVRVTGNKQLDGIMLQADSGVLAVSNNFQKLANGPCNFNTVSHRAKLQTTSVNISFVAPNAGPTKVTFRYTVVFSYTEALENKYSSFAICPPATQTSASLTTPTPSPFVVIPALSKRIRVTPVTLIVVSTSTPVGASTTAPAPTPSPPAPTLSPSPSASINVTTSQTMSAIPTTSPTPNVLAIDTCNSSFYWTDERQKYVSPDDGNTYDCALTELLAQTWCESSCKSNGNALCCDYGRPTNVTKQFQCVDTRSLNKIMVKLPVARYVRCVCSVAPNETSCSRKK